MKITKIEINAFEIICLMLLITWMSFENVLFIYLLVNTIELTLE